MKRQRDGQKCWVCFIACPLYISGQFFPATPLEDSEPPRNPRFQTLSFLWPHMPSVAQAGFREERR